MTKSVIGSFENRPAADAAMQGLLAQGYAENDISLLVTESSRGRHFTIEDSDKTSEGMGQGAVIGGALGGLAAGLTTVGAIGTGGALLAVGPIVSAFAGAGVGGAAGGLVGGLIGLGLPEHEARLSSEDVEKGSILIGVNASEDRVDKTKDILQDSGAKHVVTH